MVQKKLHFAWQSKLSSLSVNGNESYQARPQAPKLGKIAKKWDAMLDSKAGSVRSSQAVTCQNADTLCVADFENSGDDALKCKAATDSVSNPEFCETLEFNFDFELCECQAATTAPAQATTTAPAQDDDCYNDLGVSATTWRVVASTTRSGWAWDVMRLKFSTDDGIVQLGEDCQAIDSGSVSDANLGGISGYEAENAFSSNREWWGGRKNAGKFYLGFECRTPQQVRSVEILQTGMPHVADDVLVQRLDGNQWRTVHEARLRKVDEMETIWSPCAAKANPAPLPPTAPPPTADPQAPITYRTYRTSDGQYCPAGDDITTEAQCRQAAHELGISFAAAWYGPGDHKACLQANDWRMTAYWNTAPANECRATPWDKYASICQAEVNPVPLPPTAPPPTADPQAPSTFRTSEGQYCPAGDDITTEAQCRQAANALGIRFAGAWYGAGDHKACLQANDGRGTAYWNTAPANKCRATPSANYASLCHAEANR